MGKSKKRILNKNTEDLGLTLKRKEVILKILTDIKNNKISDETQKLICLFGITIEELLENGAGYEEISALKDIFLI